MSEAINTNFEQSTAVDHDKRERLQTMLSNKEPLQEVKGREQWRKISHNSIELEAITNPDYANF